MRKLLLLFAVMAVLLGGCRPALQTVRTVTERVDTTVIVPGRTAVLDTALAGQFTVSGLPEGCPADTPGLSVSLPFVALKDTDGVAVGVEIRHNTLYVRAECPPDTVPIFIDRTTTVRTPTAPACEARAAKLKLRLRNWQLAFLVALLVCFAQPVCFVFARRAGIV